MAPEGAMQIPGGNWQIFSKMVEASSAHVLLNSPAASIELKGSADPDVKAPKYIIKTASTGRGADQAATHSVAFDDVVIATPYQFSDIKNTDDLIERPIDDIPYATLHVTLFATPFRFNAKFFKLEPGSEVPISVLTTLAEGEDGIGEVGSAGFFSATLVKIITNPKTQNKEYVFKIFSPEKVTPEFLSSLLGVTVPDTFTGPTSAEDGEAGDVVEPISWYHPTIFRPYPIKYPRVTFQDPILRDGLYYTSGMDSFISTMETNALMGMNVARLIVNDHLDQASPAPPPTSVPAPESDVSSPDASPSDASPLNAEALQVEHEQHVLVEHEQHALEEQQDEVVESYGQPNEVVPEEL